MVDMLLTVANALIAAGMAWAGVKMTIQPLQTDDEKGFYKKIFAFGLIFALASTVTQAIRSSSASAKAMARHRRSNTSPCFPV